MRRISFRSAAALLLSPGGYAWHLAGLALGVLIVTLELRRQEKHEFVR